MNQQSIFEKLRLTGLIPVIKIDDAAKAVPLARALAAGGLPCAEITFRTAAAEQAIRNIAAGAKFLVAPGLNPRVVSHAQEKGITILPGCSSPSDIEAALELGIKTVKFFPAEQLGGVKMLKALAAPYTEVSFVPTGGINESNLNDYLAFDRVVACGGSWMAESSLIAAGKWDEITRLMARAVRTMLGFSVEDGMITISTENIERAEHYLAGHGVAINGNRIITADIQLI